MLTCKTVKVIDECDWNELVVKTYGKPYDLQQQEGCKGRGVEELIATAEPEEVEDYENDTVPEIVNGDEMGVSFSAWVARDPSQKLVTEDEWDREHGLTLWWHRNFYPTAESIAHDLVKRGLLEAGEYTIKIDW